MPPKATIAYDIPKARAAAAAEQVQREFLEERRMAVCSAKNAKDTEYRKTPEKFVYTKDHCRLRGSAATKRSPSAARNTTEVDKKEIKLLREVLKRDLDKQDKTAVFTREERATRYNTISTLAARMLLPHYRAKFPDPEDRYYQIKKDTPAVYTDPKYSVLSQVLLFLVALNTSNQDQKTLVINKK